MFEDEEAVEEQKVSRKPPRPQSSKIDFKREERKVPEEVPNLNTTGIHQSTSYINYDSNEELSLPLGQ